MSRETNHGLKSGPYTAGRKLFRSSQERGAVGRTVNEYFREHLQGFDLSITNGTHRMLNHNGTTDEALQARASGLQHNLASPRTTGGIDTSTHVTWGQSSPSQQNYTVSTERRDPWSLGSASISDADLAVQDNQAQGSIGQCRPALPTHVCPQQIYQDCEIGKEPEADTASKTWQNQWNENHEQINRQTYLPTAPANQVVLDAERDGVAQGPDRPFTSQAVCGDLYGRSVQTGNETGNLWPNCWSFTDVQQEQVPASQSDACVSYQQDTRSYPRSDEDCCGLPDPIDSTIALLEQESGGRGWWNMLEDRVLLAVPNIGVDRTQQPANPGSNVGSEDGVGNTSAHLAPSDFWLSPLSCSSQELTPEPLQTRQPQTTLFPGGTHGLNPSYDPSICQSGASISSAAQPDLNVIHQRNISWQFSKPVDTHRSNRISKLQKPKSKGLHRTESRDEFLIRSKAAGMSYKEIKAKGCFEEAESTLRGRYRTLTKQKEQRVRKPEWQARDVSLLPTSYL